MEMTVNLMVDYEDQKDWLQDSVIIENVEIKGDTSHLVFCAELEGLVYDATRQMHNPPSNKLRIVGYAPSDSDVTVKKGLNFWTHEDNIYS